MDDANFGAFVAGEADKVSFFEFFDRFLVSIVDVGTFLSWFKFPECVMELMVDSSGLVFQFICGWNLACRCVWIVNR